MRRRLQEALLLPFKKTINDINEAFGAVVKRVTQEVVRRVHSPPVEFPLVKDGHRPVSEEFRSLSDQLLIQILRDLDIKYHIVSGTIEQRLTEIAKIYDLTPVMPLDDAIAEARVRVKALHRVIETDAQVAALRRQSLPWHGRLLHKLAS